MEWGALAVWGLGEAAGRFSSEAGLPGDLNHESRIFSGERTRVFVGPRSVRRMDATAPAAANVHRRPAARSAVQIPAPHKPWLATTTCGDDL